MCLYGVWDGVTPTCAEVMMMVMTMIMMMIIEMITSCLKVYCPWPGYLEGGKVDVI